MFGQLGRADIAVAVTSSRAPGFNMKCHFDPEVYTQDVVPSAEEQRLSLPSLRCSLVTRFDQFSASLVLDVFAARYASDSVMPHAADDWHDVPFGAEDDCYTTGGAFATREAGPFCYFAVMTHLH